MSTQVSPQLPAEGETNAKPTYASFISQIPKQPLAKTQLKTIDFNHGEPVIKFTMEEIRQYTIEEGLHQALILKFSYGHPEMTELRKMIPKTLGAKGQCLIGLLARRHILIRFDRYEDYVMAASKVVNHFHSGGEEFIFRIFPWTIGFNSNEESSRAFTWISLPNLPPELFAKRSLLSIASAIGKPIAIDKATQEKSRPSTARVKVELDLLEKHPEYIRVQYIDENSGKVIEHIQSFVYDNLPLFCNCCKHQGHEQDSCRLMLTDKKQTVTEVKQYQGDARTLLNEKRRNREVDIDVSVMSQQGKDQKQNLRETQTGTSGKEQQNNTENDGDQLIAQVAITDPMQTVNPQVLEAAVQNNISGKPYRIRGTDRGKGVLVYREKGNTSRPVNKPTGIRICEPKSPSLVMPVVSDGSVSVEEFAGSLNEQRRKKGVESFDAFVNQQGIDPKLTTTEMETEMPDTGQQTDNGKAKHQLKNTGNEHLQNNGVSTEGNREVVTNTMEATAINNRQQMTIAKSGNSLVAVESPGHSFVPTIGSVHSPPIERHADTGNNEWTVVTNRKGRKIGEKGNLSTQPLKTTAENKGHTNGNAGHQPLFADSVINDLPQQEGNSQFACHHTKLGDACDGQQTTRTLDQNAENTGQTDNVNSDSHTLDTSSMNNSSNENFVSEHRHQLVDINLMNNVVTGGQHHNSSNWAVLVEEEDDNMGMFELLYTEESEEKTQTNPNTDNNILNPNAPEFTPHKTQGGKQAVQGKLQQRTVHDIDRELLDALIYVNPLEMKNICSNKPVYRKSYFDTEFFNSDEEDDMSDTFYKKSVIKAGIPTRQKKKNGKDKNTEKPHGANRRGNDEETVPRQLPMRQAKQKGPGTSNSTRSNKSKKK